jgi:hypothetical protein
VIVMYTLHLRHRTIGALGAQQFLQQDMSTTTLVHYEKNSRHYGMEYRKSIFY